MGGTTSTPGSVPVQNGIVDPNFDQKTSGVRITAATEVDPSTPSMYSTATSNDKVRDAYNKGKEEGVASFQSSLEQVAAQVYDGVHSKLTDIQSDSLKRSKETVEELKLKLTVPGSIGNNGTEALPCKEEQSVFMSCMKNKKPLECKEAVEAYARCAMSP